jgi:acyl-CoA synthetase (AMP-forming)/AMP-acid ligase II
MKPPIPQLTLDDYRSLSSRLIHSAVDRWASERPHEPAVLNATHGTSLTWAQLSRGSALLAGGLQRRGFRKGDVLAATLPLSNEHILLEYACFRLGVIHAPLDLRLQPAEALRCLALISPKGYAFPGKIGPADFGQLGEAARRSCPSIESLFQFAPPEERIGGAAGFEELISAAEAGGVSATPTAVSEGDGAQVIFTTGSTGSPKPALLSHGSITCQNLCLAAGFRFAGGRVLCNLPASHVGGQSELLLTTLFSGATAVTLEIFDPVKSLDAVERYGVTLIGQIPAMFQMEWRTAGYGKREFGSLRDAVYGGQSAPRAFLDRMLEMAPNIGTGLGLTEASGFCTYTELTGDAGAVEGTVGWSMPAYRLAVRAPMSDGGRSGAELPAGEIGHVCFQGPQNFLGYLGDPAATSAALSTDGWLYTGDMGSVSERGLRLAGRAKWLLKVAGYQVFPGDIETHLAALPEVANAGVVGQPHALWGDGMIAFVEPRPGAALSEVELRRHARSLTSYMRPLHYVLVAPGEMPLNRAAKVDVVRLQALAKEEVQRLRERGKWDRA